MRSPFILFCLLLLSCQEEQAPPTSLELRPGTSHSAKDRQQSDPSKCAEVVSLIEHYVKHSGSFEEESALLERIWAMNDEFALDIAYDHNADSSGKRGVFCVGQEVSKLRISEDDLVPLTHL